MHEVMYSKFTIETAGTDGTATTLNLQWTDSDVPFVAMYPHYPVGQQLATTACMEFIHLSISCPSYSSSSGVLDLEREWPWSCLGCGDFDADLRGERDPPRLLDLLRPLLLSLPADWLLDRDRLRDREREYERLRLRGDLERDLHQL